MGGFSYQVEGISLQGHWGRVCGGVHKRRGASRQLKATRFCWWLRSCIFTLHSKLYKLFVGVGPPHPAILSNGNTWGFLKLGVPLLGKEYVISGSKFGVFLFGKVPYTDIIALPPPRFRSSGSWGLTYSDLSTATHGRELPVWTVHTPCIPPMLSSPTMIPMCTFCIHLI